MINQSKYLFLVFIIFMACKSEDEVVPPITEEPDIVEEEVDTIVPIGDEQYLTLNSDYIFDQERLPTFELTLSTSALAQIDNDPAAEEYVEGSLTFEGETISPVGIRYKGSIGAFVGCVSGNNWSDPSGYKTCTKLSMKVKINWNGSDTRFYGLKKLQFHSMNNDPSQMRERLGYWLFRSMNVPAPRCVHAKLLINGEYVGLFALTEQIDGRFTRYNFEDGKGNLYKEIWPLHHNGQPFSSQDYLRALKTNEDENPSVALIKNFASEVANASSTDLPVVIDKWMNIEEVLSYGVVDRMIRNDDGAAHWYCDNGVCAPHNFYWYEEPSAETLHLIPWDLDHAFENIISNNNPVTPVADGWGETRSNCQAFSFGPWGLQQRSAACDKLFAGWATYTDRYEDLKADFIAGPFSEATVNGLLMQWEAQIQAATTAASATHDDAISIAAWESAMNALRGQVDYAREH